MDIRPLGILPGYRFFRLAVLLLAVVLILDSVSGLVRPGYAELAGAPAIQPGERLHPSILPEGAATLAKSERKFPSYGCWSGEPVAVLPVAAMLASPAGPVRQWGLVIPGLCQAELSNYLARGPPLLA